MQDYCIADLKVRMACEGRTQQQAEAYRDDFEGEPDIVIDVAEASVARERELHPELSEDDWRYMLTGGRFARDLLSYNGLVLHASAVVVDGRAYLFSAPSGGGKSTHTALWLERFPGSYLLNDDKPALRVDDEGRWWAYGTPWSGKTDLNTNVRVPLHAVVFVQRGEQNSMRRLELTESMYYLQSQVIQPYHDAQIGSDLIDRMIQVATSVPVYLLTCNMDPEAAHVAREALFGE